MLSEDYRAEILYKESSEGVRDSVSVGEVLCQHHEDPLLCPHVSPLPLFLVPPLIQLREVPARLLQVSLLLQIRPGQDPE